MRLDCAEDREFDQQMLLEDDANLNEDSDGRGGCARFWQAAKDLKRGLRKLPKTASKALIKPDGTACRTDSETATVFGDFFRGLYNATGSFDSTVLGLLRISRLPRPISRDLDAEPSLDELIRALRSLRPGKAPGASSLAPDALRLLLDDAHLLGVLHESVLSFWASDDSFADAYGSGLLRVIPKKGDRSNPANYRGIMLLEVAAKVIGKIISTRLTGLLLRDGNGMEEQCGFLPGRGCPDAFFSLKMALKKRNTPMRDVTE